MKFLSQVSAFFLIVLLVLGCDDKDTDFMDFLNGQEIIYPGRVSNVETKPGNLRLGLTWQKSPDPSVTKYVVYWNNKADSMVVDAANSAANGKMEVIIPNLEEYVYSFTIFSYDAKGNKSIPLEVNNVRVYGPLYKANLLNRPYNVESPYLVYPDGTLRLNFTTPDTINISTSVKYTNISGNVVEREVRPDSSTLTLKDYKAGTAVEYMSSYIPVKGALDTFYVSSYETFPQIISFVPCDKSLFRIVRLPNDVGAYESGTDVDKLWDGSVGPQGYPNIFHSNGDTRLPHHFTFDMGKVYNNLSHIEETGRDCCHNPTEFEVWGIADITNAATTLPSNDAGWKAESLAKGWTLLKEVARSDDGKAAMKVALMDNPPPVRYIRIRIKKVATNEASYSNLSELTLWNKQ